MSHMSAKEKRIKESPVRHQMTIARRYCGRPSEDVRARFFAPPYGMKVARDEDKER